MKRRTKRIIVIVAGVLLAGAGLLAFATYQATHVIIPNAYAVWWTADLVIEHMERHHGAWPKSWEELRATSDKPSGGPLPRTWTALGPPSCAREPASRSCNSGWRLIGPRIPASW